VGSLAQAGVTAERTRVIFPAGASETSLPVTNLNAYPVMVQVWIDNGALDSTPDEAVAPIMPLPPLFPLMPAERRMLRLVFTGSDELPTDRESLYWLNIYEVPPSDAGKAPPLEQARVVVTMHTQMKVFYRPKKLSMSLEQAVSRLHFLHEGIDRGTLHVDNPSPYYITLTEIGLRVGSSRIAIPGGLVPPFSGIDLSIEPGVPSVEEKGRADFIWLDDDGNAHSAEVSLQ